MKRILFSALLASAMVITATGIGEAKKHSKKYDDGYQYIVVSSYYEPSRQIRVPVRDAQHGTQVYVPKHGWAYCEVTCEHTVQKHYLDFWENQTNRDAPNGFVWDYLTSRGIFRN